MLSETLLTSFFATLDKIIPVVINSVAALLLLLVGFILAKIIQWLISMVLKVLAFDVGVGKTGFIAMLKKGEVDLKPSELLAAMAFWFVVILTLVAVADAFGVTGAQVLLVAVITYIPKVLAGTIALSVAVFFATVLQNIVVVAAQAVGLAGAKIISRVVKYAIVIFAFLIAINHMGFDLKWIVESINVIVGAVGLAVAIAFGLGCKDIAGDFLSNFFRNR